MSKGRKQAIRENIQLIQQGVANSFTPEIRFSYTSVQNHDKFVLQLAKIFFNYKYKNVA